MVAFLFPPPVLGTSRSITQTDSRSTQDATGTTKTFNSVATGTATSGSLIYILVWHGDTNANPGTTPSCTVGGNSATRRAAESTGDNTSGNDAVGTAIFEISGASLGGSQTVTISWGGGLTNIAITVLRVIGYSFAAASAEANGFSDGQISLNMAANGAAIGCAGSGQSSSDLVWTSLTERGQETNYGAGANNVRSWAYDINMPANAALNVQVSPWSTAQGSNSMAVARLNAV